MHCNPASIPQMHFNFCDKSAICTPQRSTVRQWRWRSPNNSFPGCSQASQEPPGQQRPMSTPMRDPRDTTAGGDIPVTQPGEQAPVAASPGGLRIAPDPWARGHLCQAGHQQWLTRVPPVGHGHVVGCRCRAFQDCTELIMGWFREKNREVYIVWGERNIGK